MKPIRLTKHARSYLRSRGFTETEVEETVRTSTRQPSELGRLECSKNFPYNAEWNGRFYATKRVRPIFVEETTEIVIITVYTYYF